MTAQHKIMATLATGAVLGAAAGILLAPKTGKETRQAVSTHATRLRHRASHYLSTVRRARSIRKSNGTAKVSQ